MRHRQTWCDNFHFNTIYWWSNYIHIDILQLSIYVENHIDMSFNDYCNDPDIFRWRDNVHSHRVPKCSSQANAWWQTNLKRYFLTNYYSNEDLKIYTSMRIIGIHSSIENLIYQSCIMYTRCRLLLRIDTDTSYVYIYINI